VTVAVALIDFTIGIVPWVGSFLLTNSQAAAAARTGDRTKA